MDKNIRGNHDDNIDDEQYMAPRVTKEEMRDVMLEALFALILFVNKHSAVEPIKHNNFHRPR